MNTHRSVLSSALLSMCRRYKCGGPKGIVVCLGLMTVAPVPGQAQTDQTVTGNLTVQGTTDSTSKDTGAIIVEGGVGVEKNLTAGGNVSAAMLVASGGNITGGASGLTLNAGGNNQSITFAPAGLGQVKFTIGGTNLFIDNGGVGGGRIYSSNGLELTSSGANRNITLTPSGTGYTLLGGNVGIGTSTPESLLDVNGTSAQHLKLNNVPWGMRLGALQAGHQFISLGVKKTAADNIYIAATGNDAAVNHLVMEMSYPNAGGGFNFLGGTHVADGTALSLTNLMHIDVVGNVGIGTTSPTNLLTIAGVSSPGIDIKQAVGNNWRLYSDGGFAIRDASNSADVVRFDQGLGTHIYGSGGVEVLTIPNGSLNVGIGTTGPTAKLDVVGDAKISGNLSVNGSFTAPNYTASGGSITGSTSAGLTLNAGGADRNITLSPTGAGSTVLNGKVGVGTSTPQVALDVTGDIAASQTLVAQGGRHIISAPWYNGLVSQICG